MGAPGGGKTKIDLPIQNARVKEVRGEGWINASEVASAKSDVLKESDLPKGASPAQLAAYTVVSRVLLNVDETITRE